MDARLGNAAVACVTYIGKMLWPTNLAPFYPHGGVPDAGTIALAVGLLLGISGVGGLGHLARSPLSGRRMALVSRDARARHRPGPGGQTVHGRSIHVYPAHRAVRRDRLGHGRSDGPLEIPTTRRRTCRRSGPLGMYPSRPLGRFPIGRIPKRSLRMPSTLPATMPSRGIIWQPTISDAVRRTRPLAQWQAALNLPGQLNDNELGIIFMHQGDMDKAAMHFDRWLAAQSGDVQAHNNLGAVLAAQGKWREAVAQWRDVLQQEPENYLALNMLAYTLATCPEASLRNGPEAVLLAEQSSRLSGRLDPEILDTLAAAYAEVGRFADAVETANDARSLALKQGKQPLAERIGHRAQRYRSGMPAHEGDATPSKPQESQP